MAAVGKTIHDLRGKIRVIGEVLFTAGKISSNSIAGVAKAAGIPYRTLQTSLDQGRVTATLEAQICAVGGFSPDCDAWCDYRQTEANRRKRAADYDGGDKTDTFRKMLNGLWRPRSRPFRARTRLLEAANRDLACHEFSDCQQRTKPPAEIQLFLEASFGAVWSDEVRYGLRTARISLDFIELGSAEFREIAGRDGGSTIGNAQLTFAGTSSRPCWDLTWKGPAGDFLSGEYRTTEGPVVTLVGYEHGLELRSTLTANIFDGLLELDPAIGPLSPNKRAIIGLICARELSDEARRHGLVDLCRQDITVLEEQDA